ncbi:MAG TPA: TonB-dependent receptor [Gemmatimonadaceae bacterium]|nr:TonB-dependent receptor [Gemmatimonadaceae bacterium]
MYRTLVVLAASVVALAPAIAQQSTDTTVLRPVVVSATRVPIGRDAAPASVTVLQGDALRSRGIANVADALATVPGLAVVQSGSFGATTALFARGGESDYMKVLVDGVPLNNPGGAFDFATLTTDNLDRIEIVRGPASVVYGSDAVVGVVQLFTRRGAGAPRGYADLRGGTFGTIEASAGVGGGAGIVGYSLGGSRRETDGIHDFNNGFTNGTSSGRVSFAPASGSLDLVARRTDATFHFPTNGSGFVVDSNAVRREHRTVLGLDAIRHLTRSLDVRVIGAATRLDGTSDNQPDSPGDSTGFYGRDDARSERRSVDVRADYRPTAHATVSVGASTERQQIRSTSASQFQRFPATTAAFAAHRTTDAVYAQLIGTATRRVTYTVSGRLDDDGTYGTFATGRASLATEVTANATLRAAVGNAFKAPAFEETFSSTFTVGNPGLDPERTASWEVAGEYRLGGRAALSATYFDQRFGDLIQYVFGDATTEFRGTNANLGSATARGLELEARAPSLGAFDVGANLTFLRTRVTNAGNGAFGTFVDGERLLRRPSQVATIDAGYRLAPAARVGATVRLTGKRDDRDFANDVRVTLPSYTLIDLSGEIALSRLSHALAPVNVTGRIENAFDREYQSAFGFDAPGRRVLIGARATLGGTR